MSRARPLAGTLRAPGDKSSTQRALLLGAFAAGDTRVAGALRAGDTLATAAVVTALGARVAWDRCADEGEGGPGSPGGTGGQTGTGGAPRIMAVVRGMRDPERPLGPQVALDCGNAGTLARLAAGLLAGRHGRWTLDGDASLRSRPMGRVTGPLAALGARFEPARGAPAGARPGERLPFVVVGPPEAGRLRGGEVVVERPSAQVKGALLLAGLAADRPLTVVQHVPTRDHTERMLPRFGARVDVEPGRATVHPGLLAGAMLDLPGDPSSAAFPLVAALLAPGSDLTVLDVGLWPRRTGFLRALIDAGAPIEVVTRRASRGSRAAGEGPGATRRHGAQVTLGATANTAPWSGPVDDEPRGDLRATASELSAFDLAPGDVPDLVDELPVLALAASRARGTSRFAGLAELRLKESDRLAGIAALLAALGAPVEVRDDGLAIGGVARWTRPARWPDLSDHRLALCALAACAVEGWPPPPGAAASAAVSYPGASEALGVREPG